MRRREFIARVGGSVAVSLSVRPFGARAQERPVPVIGYLVAEPFTDVTQRDTLAAFKRGLADTGYIDGRNVTIELHSADSQTDRLPALARELVRRQVSLITTGGTPAALAAKAATATIPIVFVLGGDPVQFGLVASLSRPGGNITGITSVGGELISKRLEMLHEVVPAAKSIAVLANPTNQISNALIAQAQTAARALGINLSVVNARSGDEITSAFAILTDQRASALLVNLDTLYISQVNQLVALAAYTKIPASYAFRLFPAAGGLMSFGPNTLDNARRSGVYAGRILKGEKPADLPVQQPAKFEMVINLKTARALGLTVPASILARADEVIE